MFYALSMFPDYFKERLNLFVALAPAVKLMHSKSPLLRFTSKMSQRVEKTFSRYGVYELFGKGWT